MYFFLPAVAHTAFPTPSCAPVSLPHLWRRIRGLCRVSSAVSSLSSGLFWPPLSPSWWPQLGPSRQPPPLHVSCVRPLLPRVLLCADRKRTIRKAKKLSLANGLERALSSDALGSRLEATNSIPSFSKNS